MPIFASQSGRKSVPLLAVKRFGTVAQLDNASGYGPEDWGFESLRYHDEPKFFQIRTSVFLYIYLIDRRLKMLMWRIYNEEAEVYLG